MKNKLIGALCAVLALPSAAMAARSLQADLFGNAYLPVLQVSSDQAQVVYYRLSVPGEKFGAANIYIDEEFHTGLLPGGYTVFCLAPGSHGLNAVMEDAPAYAGKRDQPKLELEAGKTQFLRVGENGEHEPLAISREQAEQELANNLRQAHVLSRASAVQSCKHVQQSQERSYSLSSDVLFGFGKAGYEDIREDGRREIGNLVRRLQKENVRIDSVEVVGHTDRIGRDAANEALGLRRAQTVRQLLIDNGFASASITARSAGGRMPVTQDCRGDRKALIACYASDRRVVIHLNGMSDQ
ncbi:OmpA family protein [Pseudomonas siliginis]|uniref:OmpA family protein n=1 Tax=Pseudomonas siliginis TaxID=2842346 RepID=UPI0020927DC5|nr:OmpA family protein [Pseudomonas siliginis]UST72284.1 OmpA family protein [Pseudomonas siliginis]